MVTIVLGLGVIVFLSKDSNV